MKFLISMADVGKSLAILSFGLTIHCPLLL